jgi:hypothetical protein
LLYCKSFLLLSICYNSQASTYRADFNIAEEKRTSEINSAADIAQLRKESRILNFQELKKLNAKVKVLK